MTDRGSAGVWTEAAVADLRRELGDVYEGRTVLVTGADGFMGSHLTEALVELGANVVAFVRATSSGALNNIGHLRSRMTHQVRRPHRPHLGRLPRARAEAGPGPAVRLPPRRPGPRRRVLAQAVRDGDGERRRHAQPPPVDPRPRAGAGALRHRRARRRSTATRAKRSPTSTNSTPMEESSSTSARRSIRSPSTRRRRSRPTS